MNKKEELIQQWRQALADCNSACDFADELISRGRPHTAASARAGAREHAERAARLGRLLFDVYGLTNEDLK